MSKKGYMVISSIIIVCLAAFAVYYKISHPALSGGAGNANEVTASDISKHNTSADCWVAIGSNAYDLSNYFAHNPNLDSTKFCGLVNPTAQLPSYMTTETLSTYNIGLLAP
jgi:hypothetical protein